MTKEYPHPPTITIEPSKAAQNSQSNQKTNTAMPESSFEPAIITIMEGAIPVFDSINSDKKDK